MSLGARCPTHRDAEAEASCARCGDFVCRLCTELEPLPLCGRCVARTTLEWEEPGDLSILRAFVRTFRESAWTPWRLGQRLGGLGHVGAALVYAAIAAASGLVPLALAAAALLVTFADPRRIGVESTGVLGVSVSLVLGAVIAATLWSLGLALAAAVVWGLARSFGIGVRYGVLVRASAYGASLLALPVFGPLLWPLAILAAAIAVRSVLRAHGAALRADLALLTAASGSLSLIWLIFGR